jgi:hypothetical protein
MASAPLQPATAQPPFCSVPARAGKGQAPGQGQREGGRRRQNGGPAQKEVRAPALAQRGQARKDQRGHQHHGGQRRLPCQRGGQLFRAGPEAPDPAGLLAGAAGSLRHQIGRIVHGGGAVGIVIAAALPLRSPQGEGQRRAGGGDIDPGGAAARQHSGGGAVRPRQQGGEDDEGVAAAAALGQLPSGPDEHVPAQHAHGGQHRQISQGTHPGVPAPNRDGQAVGVRGRQGRQQRRQHGGGPQRPAQPRPVPVGVGRRLVKRRLRPDGLLLRRRGRRLGRFRRLGRLLVELLGIRHLPAGKEAPPALFLRQQLLSLLHHRVHGAAHHLLHGDGAGRRRQRVVRRRCLPGVLRLRERLLRLRRVRPGERLRPDGLCLRPGLLSRTGRRAAGCLGRVLRRIRRGGGAFLPGHRSGLRRHLLQQPLLAAAAVLGQNLLQ